MNDTKIYPHSLEYAKESGELEAYWGSAKVSRECAAAIDKAISASNYEQYHYNLSDALASVTREFGLDRVALVVADVIQASESDGRYSRTNKEWAQECGVPREKVRNFTLQSHATLLDGFADKVRGARLHELAQTVGSYEKSHHMAERNRLTWFHSDIGSFAPNPGVTERRLTERCAEITEKQSVLEQLRAAKKAAKAPETDKAIREQNCNDAMKYAADLEHFTEDYYGLAYPQMVDDVGGAENSIRNMAQSILYHKTEYIVDELQSIVDEGDDQSAQAQAFLDRLDVLEKQIIDTRPVVFPVPFDTFPDCDLSGAQYVLSNGEKLRHCTYEPDFFLSENMLADGTLTTPRFYEAVWDNEGMPTSFRLTENVRIISEPIPARMDELSFRTAVEHLLPGGAPEAVSTWIKFAKDNVDSEHYVDWMEEPETVAAERWLNSIYLGLKAAKEDFGEPIAEQVCNLATIQSCLYSGEMGVAAQHLQDGRTPEDICDMVSSSELDCSSLFVPTRKDSFQPEQLYCITIESPYEAVGPEIDIQQECVPYDLIERRTEPGYLLKDGTALLECERDAYGNYQGGAGMDGMYVKTGKLYAPVVNADGQLQAFRELHNRMLRERDENPLAATEMSAEQNYNQLDGFINNEFPRIIANSYTVLDSEIVGNKEFVLAEKESAVQPFVTWQRNIQNDEQSGKEDFFWGHYFTELEPARDDFKQRVAEERENYLDAHPSIRAQLKENAAQCTKQSAAPKKDIPER